METSTIVIIVVAFFGLIAFFKSLFTVKQQTVVVIERNGRFHKLKPAGLRMKLPFFDKIACRQSLQIQELNVKVESITADKVSLDVGVAVQIKVVEAKVKESFYELSHPFAQIESWVFDRVRAIIPTMKLDDVFAKKDDIADEVAHSLEGTLNQYGFTLIRTLVKEITPDAKVLRAMNDINAAKRERDAAENRGESEKILVIKKAEAEARSKILSGEGVAGQRKAIVDGLRDSIENFQKAITGVDYREVMNLVLMTQYFDMLKELAHDGQTKVIFVPHSPGGAVDIRDQLMQATVLQEQNDVQHVPHFTNHQEAKVAAEKKK